MYNDNNKWELRYSAFFAATTFTTTGYGLQAPVTVLGRSMVLLYGLPAIMVYGVVAKKIGLLSIYFIKCCSLRFMNEKEWVKRKLFIIGFILLLGFCGLAVFIQQTSTEEGFGQGIDNDFGNAVHFLWTTTSTIGYGDMMMSGSYPILSGLIGIWLATTCGLMICFGTELGTAAVESQQFKLSKIENSHAQASHIIKIVKSEESNQS